MLGFLTQEERAELIKLYIAFFNRAPEFKGLEFHAGKILEDIAKGDSFEQALTKRANVFFEAGLAFPSSGYSLQQTMEEFVETMYSNVLLRPGPGGDAPTQAEISFWVAKLTSGEITRGEMAQQMLAAVDTLIADGTDEEKAISLQVQAALDNRVTVAEAFAQPNISGDLMGDAAVQAGIAALQGVTADPATIQPAIDAFTNPPMTFVYTQGVDNFQGGDGDDLFVAGDSGLLLPNPLQPGDMADGGGGTNQLNILANGGSQIVPDISNIQNVFINSFGLLLPVIVNFQNATGVEQIWNDRSAGFGFDAVTALNIQDEVILGSRQTNADFNADFSFGAIESGTLNTLFQDAGVFTGNPATGASMNLDIELNGNEVDTLNVWSNGVGAGNQTDIDVTGNGGTLTHVNISGGPLAGALGENPIDLDLDGGFGGLTDVDATGLSEDLIVDMRNSDGGVTFMGGAGDTTVFSGLGGDTIMTQDGDDLIVDEGANNGPQLIETNGGDDEVRLLGSVNTVLLGSGDDLLDSQFSPLTPDDFYDGGSGFDGLVLEINNAGVASQNPDTDGRVVDFEQLTLRGVQDADRVVRLDRLDGINNVVLNAAIGAFNLTLEDMGSPDGVVTFAMTAPTTGDINIDGPSSDSDFDEFSFIVDLDAGNNLTGEVDLLDVETLFITNIGDNVRFDMDLATGLTPLGTNTIILDGVAGLDLSGGDLFNVTSFDASGVTGGSGVGDVIVDIGNAGDAVTVIGGAGDDDLITQVPGFAQDDIIIGNAGSDFLLAGRGADILTGDGPESGGFADTFRYDFASESRETVGIDTITDFETGIDILEFDNNFFFGGFGSFIAGNNIDYLGTFESEATAIFEINNDGGGDAVAAYARESGLVYIDSNSNGWDPTSDADMIINMNGIDSMQQADFVVV